MNISMHAPRTKPVAASFAWNRPSNTCSGAFTDFDIASLVGHYQTRRKKNQISGCRTAHRQDYEQLPNVAGRDSKLPREDASLT